MKKEMEKFKYSKPCLSRKEFIKESGYPAVYVDMALHSSLRDRFTIRTSEAPNSKFFIITEEFEKLRREGMFE